MPLIIAKPYQIPPAAGCTSYHGPTFWTPADGITWNGTSFVLPTSGSSRLVVNGVWNNGFRPSPVDIVYTLNPGFLSDIHDFNFQDTLLGSLGSGSGTGNGLGQHTINIPLTFSGTDIGQIDIDSFGYYGSTLIDDICFYA